MPTTERVRGSPHHLTLIYLLFQQSHTLMVRMSSVSERPAAGAGLPLGLAAVA